MAYSKCRPRSRLEKSRRSVKEKKLRRPRSSRHGSKEDYHEQQVFTNTPDSKASSQAADRMSRSGGISSFDLPPGFRRHALRRDVESCFRDSAWRLRSYL